MCAKLALARSTARIGALSHMPLIPRLFEGRSAKAPPARSAGRHMVEHLPEEHPSGISGGCINLGNALQFRPEFRLFFAPGSVDYPI